jgi:pyocin large subunit-like protein
MLSRGSGDQGDGSIEPNFVDQNDFFGHFDEHKDEFGYQTPEEYLSGARNLFKGGKGIDTFYRKSDGATLFFNKNTNEFGVLNKDGTIGTYMIPENGINYWWKQIGKGKK